MRIQRDAVTDDRSKAGRRGKPGNAGWQPDAALDVSPETTTIRAQWVRVAQTYDGSTYDRNHGTHKTDATGARHMTRT